MVLDILNSLKYDPPKVEHVITTSNETASFKPYSDVALGFKIDYPPSWRIINYPHSQNDSAVAFQNESNSGFKVVVSNLPSDQTLKTYLESADNRNKTADEGLPSKQVISSTEITVANVPGVQRIESWNAAGFKTIVTYFKWRSNLYTFILQIGTSGNYSEKDREIYNQILESVVFFL